MKKHLYRAYGLDEERIKLVKEYEELGAGDFHGLRIDKRGEIYALVEATQLEVFKARLIILAYDLAHLKNRYGLRFKRHKGDFR